jgi:hypothetical protein
MAPRGALLCALWLAAVPCLASGTTAPFAPGVKDDSQLYKGYFDWVVREGGTVRPMPRHATRAACHCAGARGRSEPRTAWKHTQHTHTAWAQKIVGERAPSPARPGRHRGTAGTGAISGPQPWPAAHSTGEHSTGEHSMDAHGAATCARCSARCHRGRPPALRGAPGAAHPPRSGRTSARTSTASGGCLLPRRCARASTSPPSPRPRS